MRMTPYERKVAAQKIALKVTCPTCLREAGRGCVRMGSRRAQLWTPHRTRVALGLAIERAGGTALPVFQRSSR